MKGLEDWRRRRLEGEEENWEEDLEGKESVDNKCIGAAPVTLQTLRRSFEA